ncbi:MAG: hypothetical protein FWG85_04745 [Bacteroidetes bacterium]|nr:hypothetical protein [Bacteroidota bacterium]
MYTNILEKYNALPSNKQNDIKSFVLAIYESEQKKKLRNEIETRRQEVKTGKKTSSEDFWNSIDEL